MIHKFTSPIFCIILLLISGSVVLAQSPDTAKLSRYGKIADDIIYAGLKEGKAYEILSELSGGIGPRLSGSPSAARAVEWSKKKMEELGFDNVHLEPVMVPHWVRGSVEEASIISPKSNDDKKLTICALGGSIGTSADGITAQVLEVKSFDELKKLGELARGKIIFFNRPMDRSKISTFDAYGGAVNQRGGGAVEASRAGGVAAIVRSMTTAIDDVPHTGAMGYNDTIPKVPAAAISTKDAEMLSALLSKKDPVTVKLELSCQTLPDVESANVVGEITGSEKAGEVVVIGGHLDSWDKGRGAHDDGAGCAHVLEALRLIKELGLHPKRTIRVVTFINEENGLRGGKAYAAKSRSNEKHIAAIETDAGGFAPRGFGVTADSLVFPKIERWSPLFASIEADRIRKGGGGADISELGKQGVPTIGLRVEGHRYFDYHHSDHDTIDKVNERELELGAAAVAILAYVLAEEGL